MGPAGKELGHVPAPRAPSHSGPYNREQLVLVCSTAAGTVGIVASQAASPPPWREQILAEMVGGRVEMLGCGVGVGWSVCCVGPGPAGAGGIGWRQKQPV